MLLLLASFGGDVSPSRLVVLLTLANLGYVIADFVVEGLMVWMAHNESVQRRGNIQTLIYIMLEIGHLVISIVIIVKYPMCCHCISYDYGLKLKLTIVS